MSRTADLAGREPARASSPPPGPAEEDDRVLLARARCGDRDAFGRLVERHHRALAAILRQRFGPRAPLEDLLQDVFARALARIDGFEGRSTFLTWATSIALNRGMDWFRMRSRRGRLAPTEDVPHDRIPSGTAGPPEKAEERDEVRRAREALAGLPGPQRLAVTLRVVESLEYPEVGRRLGISDALARQWVSRGLRRLRAALNGGEP